MENLKQELERTKRMMSKIKSINDFQNIYKRRLQQINTEYAVKDNKMELMLMDFEIWADIQLHSIKDI